MYLAPLTLNYFFEKAFANDEVMEAFLSDLFLKPVKIIKRLERVHKLTNEAFYIKFDFRCKIEEQEVVVEMQRGYRKDIVRRFHLYHGVGSALQLEQLPVISTVRGKTVRDYTGVVPVLTVIWMVHDSLKTKEDFLKYQLFPSALADFVKNEELWKRGSIEELNQVRTSLNRMLAYDHKDLDFLAKNQLIFIFQRNILKNRPNTPLYKWIKFASLTNNEDNAKADFVEFENDKNFEQMMRVLNIERLENVDIDVIDQLKEDLEDMRGVIREEVVEEVRNELMEDIKREVAEEVKREVTEEVKREVTAKVEKAEKERQLIEKKQNIYEGIKIGLSVSSIAQIFSVSEEFVLNVKKEFDN